MLEGAPIRSRGDAWQRPDKFRKVSYGRRARSEIDESRRMKRARSDGRRIVKVPG